MNAPLDLFPETISATYSNEDEARAMVAGIVSDWFGTLSYQHNESTHSEILESLAWPGMPAFVAEASFHFQDEQLDFDDFAARVRHQARRAREAGLVVEDGKPKPRGAGAEVGAGDLFEEGE